MENDFRSLKAYQLAYAMAMEIFKLTKSFPKEEKYSLVDQIRRSSRSVCANIAEAYRKRRYCKHYISKLTDSDAECSETIVWLNFSKDCEYIEQKCFETIVNGYVEVGKLLNYMMANPYKFGVIVEKM